MDKIERKTFAAKVQQAVNHHDALVKALFELTAEMASALQEGLILHQKARQAMVASVTALLTCIEKGE